LKEIQNMIERLKEALRQAETSASNMEIDQIAWLIGSFPTDHWLRQHITAADTPRIHKLLREMPPCPSETHALLRINGYMNEESIVGTVADTIRRTVRS
jgi:hypothetical protein